ncbi:MAG: DnaJ domain-containing protein [Thermodesulfobacteriota bacterium]|nr:DnaJ domain-containing protein [Thermodesulfobacteriota bacterium]
MIAKDYYQTLGLTYEASEQDIKKAYRKLAMQYHPDRNGGNPGSEERIKEINEAYQILGDEEKRKGYDLLYRQPLENGVFFSQGMDDDFVTVLRKFYQMGFNTNRTRGCRKRGFGRGGCGRWKT